jgi:hypothetical protein
MSKLRENSEGTVSIAYGEDAGGDSLSRIIGIPITGFLSDFDDFGICLVPPQER